MSEKSTREEGGAMREEGTNSFTGAHRQQPLESRVHEQRLHTVAS